MKTLLISTLCVICGVAIGCGGNDVVNVDRTAPAATGSGSYSGGPAVDRNQSSGGTSTSTRRSTQSTGNTSTGNSNSNNTSNTRVVNSGRTPVVSTSSGENNDGTTVAENTGDSTDSPAADPPPPPSDYRVTLADGRTFDVGQLLSDTREDYDKRLESIASGSQMLTTYYEDQAQSDSFEGTIDPANANQKYSDSFDRTIDRPEPETSDAGGTSTGTTPPANPNRSLPAPQPQRSRFAGPSEAGGSSEGQTFMKISRINSVLRGPTAAYYRNGNPMIFTIYDRDSKRDGTLVSWDEEERPVVVDQFADGRRHGLRVLFRTRSDNDPTGRVVLVQEWRRGKLTANHLVAEEGDAQTVAPDEIPETEVNEVLTDAVTELDEFDKSLKENEQELRKALTAMHREDVRMEKAYKNMLAQQRNAMLIQARAQIVSELMSGIQSPGSWRRGYYQNP